MKKLILLFTAILIINGCSSDDTSTTQQEQEQEQTIDGGEINTLQIVSITKDNLTSDEYTGSLGGVSLTLIKTNDNELLFQVPENITLGTQILSITGIDNLLISYEISSTTLNGTPQEVLSTFFTNVESFTSGLNNSEADVFALAYIETFNNYYTETTQEDKETIAKFYSANKNWFDDIMTPGFPNPSVNNALDALVKFGLYAVIAGTSTFTTYSSIKGGDFKLAAIAGVVAVIAWNLTHKHFNAFKEYKVKVITTLINGITGGTPNLKQDNALELTSGLIHSFSLESKRRAVIASDTNDENTNLQNFFTVTNALSSTSELLNIAINEINDNFFLSNLSNVPIATVNEDNPVETALENEEYFNRINFSIESNNVNLITTFSNGNINIKATIIDPSVVVEFISTHINYTYEDHQFNRLTGSYPIRVNKEDSIPDLLSILTIGTWEFNPDNWAVSYTCYDAQGNVIDSGNGNNGGPGSLIFNQDYTLTGSLFCDYPNSSFSINGQELTITITVLCGSNNNTYNFSFNGVYDDVNNIFIGNGITNATTYHTNGEIECTYVGSSTSMNLE